MSVAPRDRPGRFSILLGTILLLLLLGPFVDGLLVTRAFLNGLFTVALSSALYSVSRPAWAFKLGLTLMVPAIALTWVSYIVTSPVLDRVGVLFTLGAFLFTAVVMVRHTLQANHVTVDLIAGALSAYLLFGLVWGLAYFLLESAAPGSLSIGTVSDEARLSASVYYSFITLTTLGYGDILPLSNQARSLALVEAVVGQLYLAVLMAKLVGMYVAAGARKAG